MNGPLSAFPDSRPQAGFLYLPIEIAARELDSRLLLAHFAVHRGLEVVLGQKWLMQQNIAALPPGFWIFKTLTPADARYMEEAKAFGNQIGAIDEEMPGLGEDSGGLRWVSRSAVESSDAVFCLGSMHHAALMAKFPEYQAKYHITGNPRWDVLRPELRHFYRAEAEQLRAEYGPFILINTNIGLMNSAKNTPDEVVRTLARHGKINLDLPKDRDFVEHLRRFESSNLFGCQSLLPVLSEAFPQYRLVLRPHPTEKVETYQAALAETPRAVLATSSTAAPWILASEALIHTSCTTGSEAFALGVPAITYQTLQSPLLTYFLSNALNLVARSADEVITVMRRVLDCKSRGEDPYPDAIYRTFHRFFAAQEGAFASERIARACAERLGLGEEIEPLGAARWQPGPGYRTERRSTAYQQQLFPEVDRDEIEVRLAEIAHSLGHATRVAVAKCGDGQYHLYDARLQAPAPIKNRTPWLARFRRPAFSEAS